MRILFVTPTPPVLMKPRPHHFVRGLGKRGHEVHLLAEAASPEQIEMVESLPGWGEVVSACASVTWVVVRRARSFVQCAASLPTRTPLRVAYCRSPELEARARSLIHVHGIQLVHVDRGQLAPGLQGLNVPKVLDATDSITLYLRRSLRYGPLAERAIAAVELIKMPGFEREMAAGFAACVVSSEPDAAALRAAGIQAPLVVLGNGVEERFLAADRKPEGETLVFIGGMSYGPNVDGAVWFVQEVLPRLRRTHPGCRLLLVGHRPARAVRRLGLEPDVEVTGTVEDVVPFLAKASVSIAPVRVGGGFSNKLVEALAAAVPTVATPAAVEGLPGLEHGVHLVAASGPADFAEAVRRLLAEPGLAAEIGLRGREYISKRYAWDGILGRLEAVYSRAMRR